MSPFLINIVLFSRANFQPSWDIIPSFWCLGLTASLGDYGTSQRSTLPNNSPRTFVREGHSDEPNVNGCFMATNFLLKNLFVFSMSDKNRAHMICHLFIETFSEHIVSKILRSSVALITGQEILQRRWIYSTHFRLNSKYWIVQSLAAYLVFSTSSYSFDVKVLNLLGDVYYLRWLMLWTLPPRFSRWILSNVGLKTKMVWGPKRKY